MPERKIDNTDNFEIVALSSTTLGACVKIATHSPDPWQRKDLETALNDLNRWSFVAMLNNEPLGFACFLTVRESADLEMLVVRPDQRSRGIGYRLLIHGLIELQNQRVERCLLEVRQSNISAQQLYERLGFKKLATRPGMYASPPEDGLLMARMLNKPRKDTQP